MERIGSLLWDVTFLGAGFCIGEFPISVMLAGFLCFIVDSLFFLYIDLESSISMHG